MTLWLWGESLATQVRMALGAARTLDTTKGPGCGPNPGILCSLGLQHRPQQEGSQTQTEPSVLAPAQMIALGSRAGHSDLYDSYCSIALKLRGRRLWPRSQPLCGPEWQPESQTSARTSCSWTIGPDMAPGISLALPIYLLQVESLATQIRIFQAAAWLPDTNRARV